MTTIKLVRKLRDCPANVNAARGQAIYDFEVLVDGYVRAIWRRIYTGKGYEIETLDRDPITRADASDYYRNRAATIPSQANMLDVTAGLLADGRIPTALDIENRRQGEDRALAMAQERELADARKHAIRKFALELYEEVVSEPSPDSFDRSADLIHRVHKEIAARQAAVREHGESFHESGYFEAHRIFPETF